MNRARSLTPLSVLLASGLTLNAWPAMAQTQIIWVRSTPVTRTETRRIPTPQTETVTGAKQLAETTRQVEQTVTGPTTVLLKEWETRRYRTPITTYPLMRQEARTITTTTTDYIRRTTTQVVDKAETRWVVGSPSAGDKTIYADLISMKPRSNYRDMPTPYLAQASVERTQAEYDRYNTLFVRIMPSLENRHLTGELCFDKQSLSFLGGRMWCHDGAAHINSARIVRYGDHDAIEYSLNCPLQEDWWWWTDCGTATNTWTLHLRGKILSSYVHRTYKDVTRDEPYSETKQTTGPWAATGNHERWHGTSRYEQSEEKVLAGKRTVLNTAHTIQAIASGDLDGRRIFGGDAGSGRVRATLSAARVRKALGANQVEASQVTQNAGAGTPNQSGSMPSSLPNTGGFSGSNPGKHLGQLSASTPNPDPSDTSGLSPLASAAAGLLSSGRHLGQPPLPVSPNLPPKPGRELPGSNPHPERPPVNLAPGIGLPTRPGMPSNPGITPPDRPRVSVTQATYWHFVGRQMTNKPVTVSTMPHSSADKPIKLDQPTGWPALPQEDLVIDQAAWDASDLILIRLEPTTTSDGQPKAYLAFDKTLTFKQGFVIDSNGKWPVQAASIILYSGSNTLSFQYQRKRVFPWYWGPPILEPVSHTYSTGELITTKVVDRVTVRDPEERSPQIQPVKGIQPSKAL